MAHPIIKIPVMVTAPLEIVYTTCGEMVDSLQLALDRYNNLPIEKRIVVQYRKKIKQKIVKGIDSTRFNIGNVPVVIIRAEEYKTGLEDLYVEHVGTDTQLIQNDDKLGSSQNYALLYPLLTFDDNGDPVNRWCAFIYDDPSKDDADIKNTIKTILTRVLLFKVKTVLRSSVVEELRRAGVVAQLKETFVSIENVENEELNITQYEVRSSAKRTKEIIYEGVPAELVLQMVDNPSLDGYEKKVLSVKVNDSLIYKYVYEESDTETPSLTTLEENNCYQVPVSEEELSHIHEPAFVANILRNIIDNFISNA